MQAPVYRSLEAKNTVLGLAFPHEFGLVLASWWAGLLTLGAFLGSGLAIAAYVLIRILNYGRAEGFVQHGLQWLLRHWWTGGRLSAAAKVSYRRAVRFPAGPYRCDGDHLLGPLLALRRDLEKPNDA